MGATCSRCSAVGENPVNELAVTSLHDVPTKHLERCDSAAEKGGSRSRLQIVSCPGGEEEDQQVEVVVPFTDEKQKSKTTAAATMSVQKMSEVGSLIGRASTAGFGRAVKALDTFGSTITNIGGGFSSAVTKKGNKIGILSFELANTIVKGSKLKQSLSEDELRILKQEILVSEGVKRLVSQNMQELLRIAAADKKEELKIFTGEVVRFGNHCQDPHWHRLDRIFNVLGTEVDIPVQTGAQADIEMNDLMTLVQYTSELYHELYSLDRMELELRRKLQDDLFSGPHRAESIAALKNDMKQQQKHVKDLKKLSLWSKMTEEVMEQLVDIVYYLHQEMINAFGSTVFVATKIEGSNSKEKKKLAEGTHHVELGASGLALHYANTINQIDSLVSRPNAVPPSTRDSLYQGLSPRMKASFRFRLEQASYKEELTAEQIRSEMEKILDWLLPVATNTTKVHHGFGWVGEWAKSGSSVDRQLAGSGEVGLLQTLHHADQEIVEDYLLELLVSLHYLVSRARVTMNGPRPDITALSI